MHGENGEYLNSKIKVSIYINTEAVDEVVNPIERSINEILISKCGAGNFVFETDVQY